MKQRKGWKMSCNVGKGRKGWRMSCDVGEVTARLENELCYDYNYELCSFSNLSFTSPILQLILQPFRRFTYVTAHSPTLPLLYLRHSSFSNPSFASLTSQALHLTQLASRPWKEPLWRASISGIYRIPSVNLCVITMHVPYPTEESIDT